MRVENIFSIIKTVDVNRTSGQLVFGLIDHCRIVSSETLTDDKCPIREQTPFWILLAPLGTIQMPGIENQVDDFKRKNVRLHCENVWYSADIDFGKRLNADGKMLYCKWAIAMYKYMCVCVFDSNNNNDNTRCTKFLDKFVSLGKFHAFERRCVGKTSEFQNPIILLSFLVGLVLQR